MFSSWLESGAAAVVGQAWSDKLKEATSGLKEAAGDLTQGVTATLQQALLIYEPSHQPDTHAVLPPWDDVGPEADALPDAARVALRAQIMSLAKNKRNFVEHVPTSAVFPFKLESHLWVARAAVEADPQLRKIRYYLVPQVVDETTFWRNYFYRIKLIREAHELPPQYPLTSAPASSSSSPTSSASSSQQPATGQATDATASAASVSGGPQSGDPSRQAVGSSGIGHDDDDDSDDEAAFLAELEALEKDQTTTTSTTTTSSAVPAPSTPQSSSRALSPGVAVATSTLPSAEEAESAVPSPVAVGGPDGTTPGAAGEEYSINIGGDDDDDAEWEKELELELRAELEGMDEP